MHEMRHSVSEERSGKETSDVVIPVHGDFSFRFGPIRELYRRI
jgi:hypothetical protein